MEPLLDISDIQGNIEPGFRMPYQRFTGLRFKDKSDLKKVLAVLCPLVTSMETAMSYHQERVKKAKQTRQFGFASYQLLDQEKCWLNIHLGRDLLQNFAINEPLQTDPSFAAGQYAQARLLGDTIDPAKWKIGQPGKEADLFLVMASPSERYLMQQSSDLLKQVSALATIEIIYQENGARLYDDTEHFGFKDGISQPDFRGLLKQTPNAYYSPRQITAGNDDPGQPEFSSPGNILVWPGQFILGYPTQSNRTFRDADPPDPATLVPSLKNSSFLVFRRLRQMVGEFYDYTNQQAATLKANDPAYADPDELRAKIIGRYKDGTTIISDPGKPLKFTNHFNYSNALPAMTTNQGQSVDYQLSDPLATKCPYFAHIRKVNPRDLPTNRGDGRDTLKLRILRRGIPFGPKYEHHHPGAAVNQAERGLLFLSYQASIAKQFEILVSDWANSNINPEGGNGIDFVIGQTGNPAATRSADLPVGAITATLQTMQNFVVPTGGEYYFTPSISFLSSLRKP